MTSLVSLLVILIVAHLSLLVFIWLKRGENRARLFRHSTLIVLSMLITIALLIPDNFLIAGKITVGYLIWLVMIPLIYSLGEVIFHELPTKSPNSKLMRVWAGGSAIWFVAYIVAGILDADPTIGTQGWMLSPGVTGIVALVGFVGLALVGIAEAIRTLYRSNSVEVFTRSIYWLIALIIVLMSLALLGSGSSILMFVGSTTLFTSISITSSAYTHPRIIDIPTGIRLAIQIGLTSILLMMGLFIAMALAELYAIDTDTTTGLLSLLLLAALITLVYSPIQTLIANILSGMFGNLRPPLADIMREYSQEVSQAGTLEEIVDKSTKTLNKVMQVNHSALILINDTGRLPDSVELIVMDGKEDNRKAYLAHKSATYNTLAVRQRPLLQYDIEFGDQKTDTPQNEINSLKELNMVAYAPITIGSHLIGILAAGAKSNGAVFSEYELEILVVMAQQIGIALRNARLIDDLQHLNASMRSLNQGLAQAKQELEKLDSVKTDFITIASHELRTPLAQVRGYTDIIDALNEQGMLDQTQTSELSANLRKATERMEELISAMLDVSQLDVNAMDLRFVETAPESVVRMAIEPLTDVIKQRRLSFTARGLRDLPRIEADMQRLVQAFRNVIVNAIKFTPDGGLIEIKAELQKAETRDGVDNILFAVRDTGVGIAANHIELIFDKFYRGYDPSLHSTGAYKFMGAGPGLGLAITKGIIEGHGGAVWAKSEGHSMEKFPGSVFYILLPIRPPKDAWRILPIEEDRKKRETRDIPAVSLGENKPAEVKTHREESTEPQAKSG